MDGERRLAVGGRRQLALLAFLLLHANEAVSSEAVSDAVWGPARSRSDNRLPMAIARLRRALAPLGRDGESLLRTVGGGYALSVGSGELDAEAFRTGVQAGRRALQTGDAGRAAELLVGALGLWRGPPLAEVAFEDFAQSETRRLEELRLVAIESRVDADLQLGQHQELVGELDVLVSEHPTREGLAAQLMVALYRCGRQADALEAYRRTRTHLAQELGLEPGPALKALQTQVLEHAPSLQPSAAGDDYGYRSAGSDAGADPGPAVAERPAPSSALPIPPTTTIGRLQDVEAVCALTNGRDVRLITLTGPGGVGKTRIALEVAHALEPSFPDGSCWVELAGAARPDDVGSTLARALDVPLISGEPPEDALRRYLARKCLLLVIDNFEHVLGAATLVAGLYAACPGLTIVITSREALNLTCEHRFVVAPLAAPPVSKSVTVADVESTDASALFVAAARRHDSRFSVDVDTAPAIARICARLDGLPLALELAAARSGLLSVEELAARLEETVSDLGSGPTDAPDRQRTLDATIEWSYRLLDDDGRRAFGRFAVFAGGATFDAARSVASAAVGTMESLVAKSLLERRQRADGRTRLVMLETVRQYAQERTAEDPGQDAVRRAHAEFYRELVERTVPNLSTHGEAEALATIDSEIDNIRAALRWGLEARPAEALRLAGQLGDYWDVRGDFGGLAWLDAALAAAGEGASAGDVARAQLKRAYQFVWRAENPPAAREAATVALELYRRAKDDAGISEACVALSYTGRDERDDHVVGPPAREAHEIRELAEAACRHAQLAGDNALLGKALIRLAYALFGSERLAALEQGAELLMEAGNYREVALGYSNAAWLAVKENRLIEALALLDVALPIAEQAGTPQITMLSLGNFGLANLFVENYETARAAFGREIQLCLDHAMGDRAGEGLAGLAAISVTDAEFSRAARLLGAARARGYPPDDDQMIDDRLELDYFADARATLGASTWLLEQQAGMRMSYEDAIAFALADSAAPGADERPATAWTSRPAAAPWPSKR